MVDIANYSQWDGIANNPTLSAKGNLNSVQLSDGAGDLKVVQNVYVTSTGVINATGFIGDGGLLSNVAGSGANPAGPDNSVQFKVDGTTFGGSANLVYSSGGDLVLLNGMYSGDGGLLSNIGGSVNIGRTGDLAFYSGLDTISNTSLLIVNTATTTVTVNANLSVGSLVSNSVIFTNASNVLSTNAGFTFDDTTNILSVDGTGGAILRNLQYGKFTEAVSKGQPIYISGTQGGNILYSLSDNSDPSKMPSIGVAITDYLTNDLGHICIGGEINHVSGSGVSNIFDTEIVSGDVNKVIYVNGSGRLSINRPDVATDLIENIGRITKVAGNNVDVLVQGAGRANDVPNRISTIDGSFSERLAIGATSPDPSANLHVTGNVHVTEDLHFTSNVTITGDGDATFVSPVRAPSAFATSNILAYSAGDGELVQTDLLTVGDSQVTIGNRTYVSLTERACAHGATTNVLVFNMTAPEAGIFRITGSMVEGSNASIHQMAWMTQNPTGTQVFYNIESFGSNTSPYGISTFEIYKGKDDTSDDTDKFTVGVTLLDTSGVSSGSSNVTLYIENIGYNYPYMRLYRTI